MIKQDIITLINLNHLLHTQPTKPKWDYRAFNQRLSFWLLILIAIAALGFAKQWITPGEQVVIEGADKLTDGTKVSVVNKEKNPQP